MALKSTITAPAVIDGVTQVNSNGDTIIAAPVVLIDQNGEFASLSGGGVVRTYMDFPTTTFSNSGDNIIIDAPGVGQKLIISDYKIQNNTTTNTVVLVKKGATIIDRIKCASEGDGVVRDYSYDKELELSENTAFVINLSNAVEIFVSGRYRVESV